jgi:hypothetical protein
MPQPPDAHDAYLQTDYAIIVKSNFNSLLVCSLRAVEVTFWVCIREVFDSNLDRDTCCPN